MCRRRSAGGGSYALKDSGKTISDTVQYYAVLPDWFAADFAGIGTILRNNNSMVCSSRLGWGRRGRQAGVAVWTQALSQRAGKSRRRYP